MWKRRGKRAVRRLPGVQFCDSCGSVCDAACRAAAVQVDTRDRVALVVPVR